MRKNKLMFIGSLGTLALGLPYYFQLIPVEAEVAQWGKIAILLGITLLILSWLSKSMGVVSKLVLGAGFFGAAVLQVPAVVLWLTMRVATDNMPPYSLAIAGLVAAPHLLLFVVCIFILLRLFQGSPQTPQNPPLTPQTNQATPGG